MKRVGARFVRTMSWVRDGVPMEHWRNEAVRRYQLMARIAEEADILLLHENYEGWAFSAPRVIPRARAAETEKKANPYQLPSGATLAPPLAGSHVVLGPPDSSILVLLHGLTGPVDGKTYVTQMVPMATNSDHWIASVLSYIRNSFGNEAPFITAKDVARVRTATLNRKTPPTHEEVKAFGKTAP